MIGNIPEKVVYISKPSMKVDWDWDDFERKYIDKGDSVLPTFVADPTKPKTMETGVQWAKSYPDRDTDPTQQTFDNTPIRIRILSLEKRSQGGRAYKVVIEPGNFYVDLREDVLLDTILETGITKGGIPNAEFIWGKVGSQMKLVRVGSELHSELIKTTSDGKKSKISQFERGGVYKSKKGTFSVYMGDHWILEYDDVKGRVGGGYYETVVDHTNYRWVKRQLWFDVPDWMSEKSGEFNPKDVEWDSYFAFKWVKKATVIEKIGHFDIPSNWKSELVKAVLKSYKDNYERYEKNPRDDERVWQTRLYYARYMSLKPVEETPELDSNPFLDPVRNRNLKIEISNK